MVLQGNAIVGQSGGPTAAINATLAGVIRAAVQNKGAIRTIYGMRNGIEGFLKEDLTNLSARFAGEEELTLLEGTPAAALGSCRKKLKTHTEDPILFHSLLSLFKKYDIRYFFYIGGNDSMDTVLKLSEYLTQTDWQMRVVGVPKTIDNDLCEMDHTPGFGSAAKYIATTVKEILCDTAVYKIPAVTIIEIMGRDAGWLTSAAALPALDGVAPDLIYLPERAFDVGNFLDSVRAALLRHPNVVVAVSEGIRDAQGHYVQFNNEEKTDAFGHVALCGTGRALEHLVRTQIGCKVRCVELSLPQRCAAHLCSLCDIRESVAVGKAAVDAACSGCSGVTIAIRRVSDNPYEVKYVPVPARAVANAVRHVPDEYINEQGNGITEAGLRYLAPLILGEVCPVWKNGMPTHIVL